MQRRDVSSTGAQERGASLGAVDLLDRNWVAQWAHEALRTLEGAQGQLNEANVFPVADSDTGTNLVLTLRHGQQAVAELTPAAGGTEAMRAFALGALMGARGNSGIIVSEYLRGFSLALADQRGLAHCLGEAARSAYSAVAHPVAGTMLTTANDAADAARRAAETGRSEVDVALAACAGARRALERSPAELDVLQEEGVLDAGAYGLTILLDALAVCLLEGLSVQEKKAAAIPAALPPLVLESASAQPGELLDPANQMPDACGHGEGEFEVMFLVEHDRDPKQGLLERLQRIGFSVVVVGGDGVWQVHVHTDDPAAALDCVEEGHARQICVRHLSDPSEQMPVVRAPGIVVATSSPGLIPDMARAGAVVLVRGSQPWHRSELDRAVIDAGTERVVVLARESDARTARQLQSQSAAAGIDVEVMEVPTDLHAVVALTAAAELLDAVPSSAGTPGRSGHRLVNAMAEAIAGLGTTIDVDLAATDPQSQALAELPTAGVLGLTMILHGSAVSATALQHLTDAIRSHVGGTEFVVLESGLPDSHAQIGTL